MPPRVEWTEEGRAQWEEDKKERAQYLDVKNDTEARVKYVLEGNLFRANLSKEGDWLTIAGGKQVWQKKVADFSGGIPFTGYFRGMGIAYNTRVHVEVKGISPGKNFQLSRLTKRNNPRQPSQHEKLDAAWNSGDFVLVALGFWDAKKWAEPVFNVKDGRRYTKWKREEVDLTIYLFHWDMWNNDVLPRLKYKSIRQQDRHLIDSASIYKVTRWVLHPNHWWRDHSSIL